MNPYDHTRETKVLFCPFCNKPPISELIKSLSNSGDWWLIKCVNVRVCKVNPRTRYNLNYMTGYRINTRTIEQSKAHAIKAWNGVRR